MTLAQRTTPSAPTREIVDQYFRILQDGGDWSPLLAEDAVFVSHAGSGRELRGRSQIVQATRGFYGMIRDTQIQRRIVDGDIACVLTRYRLQPPNGAAEFQSDVAEIFTVRDGQITQFEIYFDLSPYPR